MRVLAFILLTATTAAAQSADFVYQRRDTREETRRATLAQYVPVLELSSWHVAGPFDNRGRDRLGVVYRPELGVDLDATYEGKDGRTVTWETIELPQVSDAWGAWGHIQLQRFEGEGGNDDAIAYLYREITSDRDAEVAFQLGSDDGLRLWVNDRLVIDVDVYRGLNPLDHVITVPLVAGGNTILAKVSQGGGAWEFSMRPRRDARLMSWLDYQLERDFPSTREAAHYRLVSVLEPEGVVLEVGGVAMLPDGRPVVVTRRGEVWLVDGAYEEPAFDCTFTRFASGLHEPLGCVWRDNALLVVQRGELTRLVDTDGDDRADVFETLSDGWGVSGNYHEFAFGPAFDGAGRCWITLNVGFCGSLGKSIVPWRGWAVIIADDGEVIPVCGGLRSPNGIGANAAGDMFFTDNQGDWIGTNKLSHLDVGDWHGHPAGDRWYEVAGLPPPRGEEDFKPPAIWFPYDAMGRSASDIELDATGGAFGPFDGQLFVGDQYAASVMRVDLERVDGVYQGACFPFRGGLDSGVNRLRFAPDGSLFVGMTNRGWWSQGTRTWGLQRIVYTGVVPFEVRTIRIRPDGFVLEFTQPVDPATAMSTSAYAMESWTYERWETYGSGPIDWTLHEIETASVSEDGLRVRLLVDRLRPGGYVHALTLNGVRNTDGEPLLHTHAYYTVNVVPD